MVMTSAAKRQRYVSDLLRVTKPSELERWVEAEGKAGVALYHEVSPWIERYKLAKDIGDALMIDDDRLLAFAKIGAERAIDAAASAMSASSTAPVLVVGKQYLQILFDAIGSTLGLERARKELKKAQGLAQSTPAAITIALKPYQDSGELLKKFQMATEAYAFGMSFLKGYLTKDMLKMNPVIVLNEIGKMHLKYKEVEQAGGGIDQLLALRIVLAQIHAAIRVSFSRYKKITLDEGRRGGLLAGTWRSMAIIAHSVQNEESILEFGENARSDKWMKTRIEDLIKLVDRHLLAWLRVDARNREMIAKLDLLADLRG